MENGEKLENFISRDVINQAINGESKVSNLMLNPLTQQPVIVYTTPFVINGKTEAVLFATQTLENIKKTLEKYKISGEGFVIVLNKKDQVIIDTEKELPSPKQDLQNLLSLNMDKGQLFYENLIATLIYNHIFENHHKNKDLFAIGLNYLF